MARGGSLWGQNATRVTGQAIKRARDAAKLSQQQLAEKVLVTAGAVAQWENGNSQPTWSNMLQVSNALNLSLDALRDQVDLAGADRWLDENREALADANAFLARHGLWSDGKRQF